MSGATVRMEKTLLASDLGRLIREGLEECGAIVDGGDHPVKNSIMWEPHGSSWVLVVVDCVEAFQTTDIQLHFPDRYILYIVQGLDDIDEQLIQLQATAECCITETRTAKESV